MLRNFQNMRLPLSCSIQMASKDPLSLQSKFAATHSIIVHPSMIKDKWPNMRNQLHKNFTKFKNYQPGLPISHLVVFTDGKVMMEYIGATGIQARFTGVPIDPKIDFHFLLSSAVDADTSGKPQNGIFSPYWASTLTPRAVQAVKAQHPNVKVLASLAGWSLGEKVIRWYKPADRRLWIANAFTSLRSLAGRYHLDGIDVDYENFPKNDTSFAFCIGELITMLKNQSVITVATIAPYYKTVDHYMDLYQQYGGVIDYVNHQFYTDRVRLPTGYLEAFKLRATQFNATKLLPSYEVNGRGIQGDAFVEALKLLKSNGFEVNGVMIFSADASSCNGYYL